MATDTDPLTLNFFPSSSSTPPPEPSEPTVLEYARFHGLCRNYLEDPIFPPANIPDVSDDLCQDLWDPPSLPDLASFLEGFSTKEKLVIDRAGAIFLKSVIAEPEAPKEEGRPVALWKKKEKWKVEVPLLRTEPEEDLKEFGAGTRGVELGKLMVPLAVVDEEKDEGLLWSAAALDMPNQVHRRVNGEKLEISKDSLLLLQSCMKVDATMEEREDFLEGDGDIRRMKPPEPVTPPLLPLSPSPKLDTTVPSAEYLELLSDSTDSVAAEVRALETEIMKNDTILPEPLLTASGEMLPVIDEMDLGQIYTPLQDIDVQPSYTPYKGKRDLRVETPLTPPSTFESPGKHFKTVSFVEAAQEHIPGIPPMMEGSDDFLMSQAELDEFFKDEIIPAAEAIYRQLEQEQLQEVDTTMRVDVPILDFAIPPAPWQKHTTSQRNSRDQRGSAARRKTLLELKKEHLGSMQTWPGVGQLDHKLPWTPFPLKPASPVFNESIQDDEALSSAIAQLKVTEIVSSSSLTWKPDGFRILDGCDESDEEIEYAATEGAEGGIGSLLRKRKAELEESELESQRSKMACANDRYWEASALPARALEREARVSDTAVERSKIPSVLKEISDAKLTDANNGFSTSSALRRFMETQGKKTKEVLPLENSRKGDGTKARGSTTCPVQVSLEEGSPTAPSLKLIPVAADLPPCSFIASSDLLKQRPLMKHISSLYPSADFIERDYTSQHSPSPEADLILSPACGLILTSLQKIKQRPLPGQQARDATKQRISILSERYEQLMVFVGDGQASKPSKSFLTPNLTGENESNGFVNTVDARDTEALARLSAFCASLEGSTTVSFVPGGEEGVARWVVNAMSRLGGVRAGMETNSPAILQDETLWELLLRRLGINPYGAQSILAVLKSAGEDGSQGGSSGLAEFMLLDSRERVARFSARMGGERILRRVGEALNREWLSAASGYRL